MPITIRSPIRRLSQAEFGDIAYSVMGTLFQIHRDFGRLFDEKIYKRELASRHAGVELEVPIEVAYGSYRKTLYLDVLVDGGGPFELKTVDAMSPRHKAQLLNYLLLAGLGHGKLVNLGKDTVEHEFVNTTLTTNARTQFEVVERDWRDTIPGAARFRDVLLALVHDWGTGLDLALYQEAVIYFFGGEAHVLENVKVRTPDHKLGHQKFTMAAPRVAFWLTTLPQTDPCYHDHAHRLVLYTDLRAMLWANIGLKQVTLTLVT